MKKEGCSYVEIFRLCFMNIYVLIFGVNLQCTNTNIWRTAIFGLWLSFMSVYVFNILHVFEWNLNIIFFTYSINLKINRINHIINK